jgi:hypothetical protein
MNLESIQGAAEFLQKVYSFYLLQFEYLVLPASFRREASLPEAVSAVMEPQSKLHQLSEPTAAYGHMPDNMPSESLSLPDINEAVDLHDPVEGEDYVPLVRTIKSHGGLDLTRIELVVAHKLPTKETFGKN